jgi:hypothetical protein
MSSDIGCASTSQRSRKQERFQLKPEHSVGKGQGMASKYAATFESRAVYHAWLHSGRSLKKSRSRIEAIVAPERGRCRPTTPPATATFAVADSPSKVENLGRRQAIQQRGHIKSVSTFQNHVVRIGRGRTSASQPMRDGCGRERVLEFALQLWSGHESDALAGLIIEQMGNEFPHWQSNGRIGEENERHAGRKGGGSVSNGGKSSGARSARRGRFASV